MNQPTFDADGYPTDETLDAIAKWPHSDPDGWFTFIRAAWNNRYGLVRKYFETTYLGTAKQPSLTPTPEKGYLSFATGGWSGNESIIEAMQENKVLWILLWESSHRGGKYVFRLPEEKR